MKLSVVIPSNGRGPLFRVLEALAVGAAPLTDRVEVLVGADNWDVPSELKSQFPWVRFFRCMSGSPGEARNACLPHANGDIIAFLGDDTIPCATWLAQVIDWHTQFPETEAALLGYTPWTNTLMEDDFHRWLLGDVQFDYAALLQGKRPSWKHFYTCNVSVKRALLQQDLFDDQFTGWGYEDTELGYRLHKRGMDLRFDPALVAVHDHPQTLAGLVDRSANARQNAEVFQRIHPEVRLFPTKWKLQLFQCVSGFLGLFPWLPKRLRWWLDWKRAWLGR